MATRKDDMLDRQPPQAEDIERAVISAMLFDKKAVGRAIELLNEECFYKPANAVVYRAMTDLYDQHIPIDQLTVSERLKQKGQLKSIGGEDTLAALATEISSAANIEYHCHILKEKALLRQLITLTGSVRNKSYDDTAEPSAILDTLEEGIMSLSKLRQSKEYVTLGDSVQEAHQAIEEKAESKGGLTGIDTGFDRLNKLTSGWQKSDLIIIAGRPSMGKTAFALDLAKNAAEKDVPVGVFSLEMSTVQLVTRLLYNEGRFDGSSMHVKKPKPEDWNRLSDACNRLHNYPIFIDDTPGLSSIELSAKAKRLKSEHDIGLLVVDYLQLMQGTTRESRQQEISSISRNLKMLAKELDIPIIALSQLSRALEQRGGDHRPMLSDLRESGAIEQDADLVIFLYRSSVYGIEHEYTIADQNVPMENVAEVIIRKQRNGPIGTILLNWIKEYTRFTDFDYMSSDDFY